MNIDDLLPSNDKTPKQPTKSNKPAKPTKQSVKPTKQSVKSTKQSVKSTKQPTKAELKRIKQMEYENRIANAEFAKQQRRRHAIINNYVKKAREESAAGIINQNSKHHVIPANTNSVRPVNQNGVNKQHILNKINKPTSLVNGDKADSIALPKPDNQRVVVIEHMHNRNIINNGVLKKLDELLTKRVLNQPNDPNQMVNKV